MKYIVGNFKMNGDSSMMIDWIQKFSCNSKNKIIILIHILLKMDFQNIISSNANQKQNYNCPAATIS